MMPTYVQFQVERIQAYLARTNRLAARRAASAMVSDMLNVQSLNAVAGWERARVPSGSTDPDGKLTVEMAERPSEADLDRAVLTLGRTAPGAQLAAIVVEVDTSEAAKLAFYATAPATRRLPAILDEPFGRPCDWCGHDVARSVRKVDGEKDRSLCADCCRRHAGRRESRTRLEQDLAAELGKPVPQDMGDLALLCPPSRGVANHLATIYIDGNNLGKIFGSIEDKAVTGQIAALIDSGVRNALIEATKAIDADTMAVLPVIPHVCAGDDVLVSVPAPLSLHFIRSFHAALDRHINCDPTWAAVGGAQFTAGAGIVVADVKHPFADLVRLADHQISIAKKTWQGAVNAFAYLDLTSDGPKAPADRRPWATAWLYSVWGDLDDLAALGNSARSTFAHLLATSDLNRADILDEVREAAAQRGAELPGMFVARGRSDWPAPNPNGYSVNSGPGRARLLSDALAMTKRWPKPVSVRHNEEA